MTSSKFVVEQRIPFVTYGLMAFCALIFIVSEYINSNVGQGWALYFIDSPMFSSLQLLTYLFVHGSLTHLGLNMLGLFIFGSVIEKTWGSVRFIAFYILCGLGAAVLYQGVSLWQFEDAIQPLLNIGMSREVLANTFIEQKYFPNLPSSREALLIFISPLVGASGAIYGILVAFASLFPNHKMVFILLPFPIAAKYFVPGLLLLDVLLGLTGFSILGSQVAHSAHIGGALTGLLLLLFGGFCQWCLLFFKD